MKRLLGGLVVCCAVSVAAPVVQADDTLDVVKKAIKANGGKAVIEKQKALVLQGKGTVDANGMKLEYTATWKIEYPRRMRVEIDTEVMGQTFKVLQVYNGKEGWQKVGDMETMSLPDGQLSALKMQLQVEVAGTFVPLLDKTKYTVSNIGDVKVNGKPAIGLNVTNKTGMDVNFYLDPKTYLLIKQEYQTKNETGKEVTQSVFMKKYKKVKGVPFPMSLEILHDGKKYVTAEFSDVAIKEKLEDSLFKKP